MLTPILRGVLVGALLLAAAAAPAHAQTLVRGTVVDEDKKPLEGVLITFDAVEFVNKRDVKTDRRGQFLFQGLQPGPYRITTEKEGYQTITQTQTVSLQGKLDLNMTMLSLKRPTTPAGAADAPPELGAIAGAVPPSKDEKETAALRALATQAMESYRAERYEESATQLSELVTKMPTCGNCYLFLGNSYVALKRNEDAEKALLKAVELEPSVEGYTALTRLYNSQRNFERAAEMSQKAADLAAAPPPAPAAAGAAAPGAAAAGAPATAPPPLSANSETLYNQGVVLWNSGKFAEAKVQFEAAIKANPENASAHYQLGLANLNLGQLPQARAAFEQYLKVAPNGPRAAEVKAMLGQLPK